MLNFGNKEFRNLQEQVLKNMDDIEFILQEEGVLNQFGIKVVGQVEDVSDMPTVAEYKEENEDWAYGDAFAVGEEDPYSLYILTRANGSHPNDYWFDIGQFPVPGPQGPAGQDGQDGATGPQGPKGDKGDKGDTGLQGPQGPQGETGATGATGAQGPQGEPGTSYVILGTVADYNSLPSPDTVTPANGAYMVGASAPYNLYVVMGASSPKSWLDCGVVSIGPQGPQGETGPQGPQGETGATGAQGPQGATGPQGPQGQQGIQGIQGPAGEAFAIYQTYASIAAMNADAANVPEGKFVLIASTVEDPDNSKLYVKNSQGSFTYLTDMSGATGIQGPQGPQGIQGIQGEQGIQGIQGPAGADGLTTAIQVNGETYTQVHGTIILPDYPEAQVDNLSIINDDGILRTAIGGGQYETMIGDIGASSFVAYNTQWNYYGGTDTSSVTIKDLLQSNNVQVGDIVYFIVQFSETGSEPYSGRYGPLKCECIRVQSNAYYFDILNKDDFSFDWVNIAAINYDFYLAFGSSFGVDFEIEKFENYNYVRLIYENMFTITEYINTDYIPFDHSTITLNNQGQLQSFSGNYNDLYNKPTIPAPTTVDELTIITDSQTGALETAIGGYYEAGSAGGTTTAFNGANDGSYNNRPKFAWDPDIPTLVEAMLAADSWSYAIYDSNDTLIHDWNNVDSHIEYTTGNNYFTVKDGDASQTSNNTRSALNNNDNGCYCSCYINGSNQSTTLANNGCKLVVTYSTTARPEVWHQIDGRYVPIDGTTITLDSNHALQGFSGSYSDLSNKPDLSVYALSANLATVATSGLYSDLSGTPSLATVATSGSYTDLSNKPTIPTSADYVALTGNQTVGGVKTFNSPLYIGTILGNDNDSITISAQNSGKIKLSGEVEGYGNIAPATYLTGTYNLGASDAKWKNLYLSGNLSDGTNTIAISNIAAKSSLATVATSGDYGDLSNTPTTETWTFTMADMSVVTKKVYVDNN